MKVLWHEEQRKLVVTLDDDSNCRTYRYVAWYSDGKLFWRKEVSHDGDMDALENTIWMPVDRGNPEEYILICHYVQRVHRKIWDRLQARHERPIHARPVP